MPYQHNRASGREKKQTNKQKQELGWKLEEEQHKDTIQNLKLSCVRVLTYWLNIDHIWSTRCRTTRKRGLNVNRRKQPTFRYATTGSREMTSEKRAQKFHTDDASLHRSGWLIGRAASTNQKHLIPSSGKWHVISMEFLRLFLRRHFAWKPVVASRNVGCFLWLFKRKHK